MQHCLLTPGRLAACTSRLLVPLMVEGAQKRGRGARATAQAEVAEPPPPEKKTRSRKKPIKKQADQSEEDSGSEGPAATPVKVTKTKAAKPEEAASSTGLWLMKNEIEELSMDSLAEKPNQTWHWDGVRSYEARKHLRNMKVGDQFMFYYSSCKEPGIAGIAKVVRTVYPDHTAWDPKSPYYDAKSTPDNPVWEMVDVTPVRKLDRYLGLAELKTHKDGLLKDLKLFTRFRLSVMPLSQEHWDALLHLEKQPAPPPPPEKKKKAKQE